MLLTAFVRMNHSPTLKDGSGFLRRSSFSSISSPNKYESGEKINAAARRTLLVDSGSETDSKVYERYVAVRGGGKRAEGQEEANRPGGKNKPAERIRIDNDRKEVWQAERERGGEISDCTENGLIN